MLFFLALSLVFFSFSFSLAFSSQLLRAMSLYFTVTACRRCVRYFNKLLALGPVFTSMCRIRWFRHLLPPTSLYSFRFPPSPAPPPPPTTATTLCLSLFFSFSRFYLALGSPSPSSLLLSVCVSVCLSMHVRHHFVVIQHIQRTSMGRGYGFQCLHFIVLLDVLCGGSPRFRFLFAQANDG